MSTRCFIGMMSGNHVRGRYCMQKGELSETGVILDICYQNIQDIRKLMIYNKDIEFLGTKPEYISFVDNTIPYKYYDMLSDIHFSTRYTLYNADNLRCKETYNDLNEFFDDVYNKVVYLYLYDVSLSKWHVYYKTKNEKFRHYTLHRLLTDKEYMYKFKKETGNNIDLWQTVKSRYNRAMEDLSAYNNVVAKANAFIHNDLGLSDYSIVFESDFDVCSYTLYKIVNREKKMSHIVKKFGNIMSAVVYLMAKESNS